MQDKNLNEGYKLIPLSEITPEAREIAVRWVEGYEPNGFDLPGKHKLASDIMNYAKKYAATLVSDSEPATSESEDAETRAAHWKGEAEHWFEEAHRLAKIIEETGIDVASSSANEGASVVSHSCTDGNSIEQEATNEEIREAFKSTPLHAKPYGTTDGYINTLKNNLALKGLIITKRK